MKRLTLMRVLMTLMILVIATGAQAMKGSADVVKCSPPAAGISVAAGQRVAFDIKLEISKKWHIYAHGDSNYIGVDLVAEEGGPLQDIKVEYPHGHEGVFFGEKVVMIEGKDVIKVSALVPASLDKGDHVLKFAVTVQACDDKTCLPPTDLPVSVKLTVK